MSKYKHKRSDLIERLEAALPQFEFLMETVESPYARGLFAGYHDSTKSFIEALSEVE